MIIKVYGTPAPQGSKKFVGTNNAGRGIMIESSKKVRPWRQDVKAAAELVRNGAEPMDGPLIVTMVFTLPKPASAPKRRVTHPDKKPDLSKLIRSTEDALTDSGAIKDDARIVRMFATKVYPGEGFNSLESPGVYITIERVAA